ncbi:restriction endonuclease subunit S [Picosynechococcus sp. PCC 8807]|uniref:restriction endonuclease subunit S n=1 Tax=Picosynechococcus sp. PCC 8807 TaxID=195248 RepID=UPI000810CF32|nr:restriction endonuclease subunit S [Picosynechococcus sp. PCC 8807]ANV91282.1 hypothetical protein AWQ24_11935 [Picosynechococcus sp. PCC 8807]
MVNNIAHNKYPASVQHGKPRLSPLKEGWRTVKIGDLVTEINRPVEMKDEEIYTLVTAKRSRGGIVKRENLKGKDIAVKSQFYIREGDFLISKRQIVHGACGFVPKELDGAIVSNEYLVLNCTDIILPGFLDLLKETVYFQQICFHSSIGVHVEKMLFKVAQWYRWKINIPTIKEQEKIASFLGAIATRLTQLHRKQELLQTYKRGVMQKIFSQEIRFKQDDGSDFPDWQKKKLGELGSLLGGGTPRTSQSNHWIGNIPWISSSDIEEDSIYKVSITRFINEAAIKESATKIIPPKSILIVSRVGVGKIAVSEQELCTSQDFSNFTPNKGNIYFLAYWFLAYKKKLLSIAQGTSIKGFTIYDLSLLKIDFPHLKEQEKIANFLTAIDQKIEAVGQQIERMEQFKKGLLQKMFV